MAEPFTQTSHEPYNRHDYKLVYVNGESVTFDNYQDVQESWWNSSSDFVSHIEVLDKKSNNKKRGFK